MTNRPTYAQLEGLVEFLEQNPGIAKGLLKTSQGKLETKRKSDNLAISLNSLGGANKNGQAWAKYWAEKKCALKKQCVQDNVWKLNETATSEFVSVFLLKVVRQETPTSSS